MLEAYTTLGFLAAHTSRVELLSWVTAVVYREPGLLAKMVSTLDVLSGGRAWLGIGAAWNEDEVARARAAVPADRRAVRTAGGGAADLPADVERRRGRRTRVGTTRLERTLNVPQALRRPHPPILIGGGGERKTLRLVAQYADACNLFPGPELERKLDVLRGHCADVGRDYAEIEKTVMMPLDVGPDGANVEPHPRAVAHLGRARRPARAQFDQGRGVADPAGDPRRERDPRGRPVLRSISCVPGPGRPPSPCQAGGSGEE